VREYDLIADWYQSERRAEIGVAEVAGFASLLPRGARVLDVGCGNGIPITRALLAAAHRVVGIDVSREMLARFRVNCSSAPAVRGIVQSLPFADSSFDAAVAWGVIFHLTQPDEAQAFASVSRVLRPGAALLFTAGKIDDAAGFEDTMAGVMLPYYSFSTEGYRALLAASNLTLLDVHTDAWANTYYRARKIGDW
jgi:ubiquinone/menaquinone biosynthesis C-methylase UbiE